MEYPTQTIPENDITATNDGPTICRANRRQQGAKLLEPAGAEDGPRDRDEEDLKRGEEQSHCKQKPSDALQRMQEENGGTAQASASR